MQVPVIKIADEEGAGSTSTVVWPGGACSLMAECDAWEAGSVDLEYCLPDETTYVSMGSLTQNGVIKIDYIPPGNIRCTVVSAIGVNAWILRI